MPLRIGEPPTYNASHMSTTSDDDTSHYEGALLEEIRDQVKAIAEGQAGLWDKVDGMNTNLTQDMTQIKEDLSVVKTVVTEQVTDLDDHERRLKNHDGRITRLEGPAAA